MCQSCGMPIKKDPQGGGTEADGSLSVKYCSYCYQHGVFTTPNMTALEMQKFVAAKLKEMHYPAFIARFFAKGIPELERWKSAPVVPQTEQSPRDESVSGTGDMESGS